MNASHLHLSSAAKVAAEPEKSPQLPAPPPRTAGAKYKNNLEDGRKNWPHSRTSRSLASNPNMVSVDNVDENKLHSGCAAGATEEEIDFLLGDGERGERVELNAMPSDSFVEFLEGTLANRNTKVCRLPVESFTMNLRTCGALLHEIFPQALEERLKYVAP